MPEGVEGCVQGWMAVEGVAGGVAGQKAGIKVSSARTCIRRVYKSKARLGWQSITQHHLTSMASWQVRP